jgi:3-oxoacyl-[acyl-carrier protein] reductase
MPLDLRSIVEKPAAFPDLNDQVVIITGGGSGIGRGIALRLAAEGMKIAVCGRNAERLAETVSLIGAGGGTAVGHPCDVGQRDQVAQLFDFVVGTVGPIDALVHNAMNMGFYKFDDLPLEKWEETFATACRGGYLLARHAVPAMRARGRGGIVFISSVGAQRAHRRGLPYDAAKAAEEAMIRGMAIEFAADGVRVNGVAPGGVRSHDDHITEERLRHPHIPMGRSGTPAEIAAVVAFLLSHQSSYVTGQTIYADGGATAQLSPPGIFV